MDELTSRSIAEIKKRHDREFIKDASVKILAGLLAADYRDNRKSECKTSMVRDSISIAIELRKALDKWGKDNN